MSSSDLVLNEKITGIKSFCLQHINNFRKKTNISRIFVYATIRASTEGDTHIKIMSFGKKGTAYSATAPVGYSYSTGLFPCFSLEGIRFLQGIFSVSIL